MHEIASNILYLHVITGKESDFSIQVSFHPFIVDFRHIDDNVTFEESYLIAGDRETVHDSHDLLCVSNNVDSSILVLILSSGFGEHLFGGDIYGETRFWNPLVFSVSVISGDVMNMN